MKALPLILAGALALGGCPPSTNSSWGPQPGGASEGDTNTSQTEQSSLGERQLDGSDCPSAQDAFGQMEPATYLVVIEYRIGPTPNDVVSIPVATAFAIDANTLATAAHVVAAALDTSVLPIERVLAAQAGTKTVVELTGAVAHPAYNENPLASSDVGIFHTSVDLPAHLQLPKSDALLDLAVGDEVLLSGFPGDVNEFLPVQPGTTVPQATSLSGSVSALRSFDPTVVLTPEHVDVIQHQIPTTLGTSGAALVHCGEVVGVHNAGTVKLIVSLDSQGELVIDRTVAGANGFGIHVKYLLDLLQMVSENKVALKPLPAPDPNKLTAELLTLINHERQTRGLGAVARSRALDVIADAYAEDMLTYSYSGPENPVTHETWRERANRATYAWSSWGECQAHGQTTPAQVVSDLIQIDSAAQQILKPEFTDVGLGVRGGGTDQTYWAIEFACPTPTALPAPAASNAPPGECARQFYDAQNRVGFDPPAGFVQDNSLCTTCVATWSDGAGASISLSASPLNSLSLDANVDIWISVISPDYLLLGRSEATMPGGERAIILAVYDPLYRVDIINVWADSSTSRISWTWMCLATMYDQYETTAAATAATLCLN